MIPIWIPNRSSPSTNSGKYIHKNIRYSGLENRDDLLDIRQNLAQLYSDIKSIHSNGKMRNKTDMGYEFINLYREIMSKRIEYAENLPALLKGLKDCERLMQKIYILYPKIALSSRLDGVKKKIGKLEKTIEDEKNLRDYSIPLLFVGSILSSLFFFSFGLTGNAIGILNNSSMNGIGGILLSVGLIAGFFYLNQRRLAK